MEEVRGQLAGGVLAEVLRHAAFLRENGRVDVSAERDRGWIIVREGRPVHAVCRRPDGSSAHGLEALALMLSWPEGAYAFELEETGASRDTGTLPADAFLEAEDVPRTLSGDTEAVLKDARAYAGHRSNGKLADVRMRVAPAPTVDADREVANRVRDGIRDSGPATPGSWGAGDGMDHGRASASIGDAALSGGEPVSGGEPAAGRDPLSGPGPSPGEGRTAVGVRSPDASDVVSRGEPRDTVGTSAFVAPARIRSTSVLTRLEGGDPEPRVTVSRGALQLWRHLDGLTPLGTWCAELGDDGAVLERRADELVRAGLAVVEPEPVYGSAFVSGLTEALNDIMGPMGEIVVQDALAELDLDPGDIPLDRVDDLSRALAAHLHRSDWHLKLQARVARLRAETMETRTEASP